MFSKTCEYALRAMLFVGQKSRNGNKITISEIARGIDSPEYFIAKILQVLNRKRLIQSQKGPSGGFYLSRNGLECTLADIVRAIDGDEIFTGCGLGLKSCSEKEPCPIHDKFSIIRKDIRDMLESVKLGECNEHLEKKLTFLKRV
ncbi:MAG TPA: Rrf2 family transcriptional regulator [Agriterribacter sp.]|nr:Rrf2 family transcriptional regulator [Chitinophagaceae bacterium]HRP32106.1 Rrf2 family transcriptional regulator [Agriterribacter sp.]